MKGVGNIGQICDCECPDSGKRIPKAEKNQLASAGIGDDARIDGNLGPFQKKTQDISVSVSQSQTFHDFS